MELNYGKSDLKNFKEGCQNGNLKVRQTKNNLNESIFKNELLVHSACKPFLAHVLFFMRVNLAFHFFGQESPTVELLSLVCTVVLSRFQIAMSKREKFFQSSRVQVLCLLPTQTTQYYKRQEQQLSPPQSSDFVVTRQTRNLQQQSISYVVSDLYFPFQETTVISSSQNLTLQVFNLDPNLP